MKKYVTLLLSLALCAFFVGCNENEIVVYNPIPGPMSGPVSDEILFRHYIEYNARIWGEILAGLEQDDFTAWNENDRFMGCTQRQTAMPIRIAQGAFDWWSSEVNAYDLIIIADFGIHNGYWILSIGGGGSFDVAGATIVAGYLLSHNCCWRIFAYDGNTFHDIRDAYELGLLRQSDISAIYNDHFADCDRSRAAGEWEPMFVDEDIRELSWVATPNGNRVSLYYNIRYFEHLNLTEDEIKNEVLQIADVVIDSIMPMRGITAVTAISISKYCTSDQVYTNDENSFFVRASLQHDSGMRSSGGNILVHRMADGQYEID